MTGDECPTCQATDMVMVEYDYTVPEHYDGISEYLCLHCRTRVGRWTGNIMEPGQREPRFGGKP